MHGEIILVPFSLRKPYNDGKLGIKCESNLALAYYWYQNTIPARNTKLVLTVNEISVGLVMFCESAGEDRIYDTYDEKFVDDRLFIIGAINRICSLITYLSKQLTKDQT